jgi:hypothetical protein
MDDPKALIYIIFLVIFILARLFRQKNKEQQQQPPHVPPPQQHQQPPPYRQPTPPEPQKEKTLLETIMEEVERQKELSKPKQPEIKQKTYKPAKKPQPRIVRQYSPVLQGELESSEPIDHIEREEGISSISERLKRSVNLIEEPEPERKFEFDPREAFMMKTLLERPYS